MDFNDCEAHVKYVPIDTLKLFLVMTSPYEVTEYSFIRDTPIHVFLTNTRQDTYKKVTNERTSNW